MYRWLVCLIVVGFGLAILPVNAAEEPADADKKEAQDKSAKPRKLRLVKPWADISSLNDEQKQKIAEIHADYVEKMNQLRDEEEAAILALLTDENKAELERNQKAQRQAAKERAAQRKAEQRGEGGTTKPSDD